MKKGWRCVPVGEITLTTDYVANGSFASLRENVKYLDKPGFAVLVRFTDFTKKWNGSFRFVSQHAFNFLSKSRLEVGDLIMGNVGDPGKTFLLPDLGMPMTLGPNSILIRADQAFSSNKYLYFYFSSPSGKEQIASITTGTTQKKFNKTSFRKLPIPLPSIPEQQRIVGILDEAFAGIATAKANAEKNHHNARALFESHLNAVFSQPGEGWVKTTLGDVSTLKSGNSVKNALEKPTGDLPYVKVADMTCVGNEDAITTSTRFLNQSDTGANAAFPPGTTIFPKRGGAILTNKKRLTAVPIYADLNIMGVIPSKALFPKFLYFYFLNVDMRKLGSGSSIPQINNYDIAPLTISFPSSVDEQARIAGELESLSAASQRLAFLYQQKLTSLGELKKSLLHQAFSGEL